MTITLAGKTIVICGDSIAAGGVLAPGDRIDIRLGYRLAGPNAGQAGYPTILNRGVGGMFLCGPNGLAAAWPAMIATLHPGDILVPIIGMNDLYTYAGDAAYTAAHVQIVAQAQAAGLTCYPTQITPLGSTHWNVETLRQHLNTWYSDHYGDPAILRFPDVLHNAATGQSWLDPRFDSGDGTHPNAWGSLYMADMIAAKILAA